MFIAVTLQNFALLKNRIKRSQLGRRNTNDLSLQADLPKNCFLGSSGLESLAASYTCSTVWIIWHFYQIFLKNICLGHSLGEDQPMVNLDLKPETLLKKNCLKKKRVEPFRRKKGQLWVMNVSLSNILEIRWPRKMHENFMSQGILTLEGTLALAGIAQ